YFDVVQPYSGIQGTEIVADYVKLDTSTLPAGVAYTHQSMGYQTVNLGFGMEFMMDSMETSRTLGYYVTGIFDRVNLMGNILGDGGGGRAGYFGQVPDGPGTGIDEGLRNRLSHAYPNPFNPMTRINYSVKEAGPVTIEVYNVAGKVVRTLLDTEFDAGIRGFVDWDGTNDGGRKCASGVYFYRIAAPNFTESHKMIMLK
ncbi:T9SS type A sorting domain-containing protein, partial [bacterium]|nr:T9SS type A sorting domain-containing protein [bacterium]